MAESSIPTNIDPDEYFKTDPGIPFHLLRRKKGLSTFDIILYFFSAFFKNESSKKFIFAQYLLNTFGERNHYDNVEC